METLTRSRSLSSEGIEQAKHQAEKLGSKPVFDLVIASSATRAKETAKIIVGILNITVPFVELGALYEPSAEHDQALVNKLLSDLGSVPLNVYQQQNVHGAWDRYSESAYLALCSVVERYNPENVLVVAHGNIINSIGLLFSDCPELNYTYFNYCEGFELFNGKCKLL